MPPRMFCFPDDQAILIKHSFETFEDGPLFGRNIGTLVLKQFLDLRTAEQLQAGILDWRSSEQDLILFLRWVYTDDLAAPDGGLPSNVDLISLASIAGLLELAKLHDDILDALDLLHCRKHWAASASVSCWDQWNRPVANEEPAFWKKRHDYLVARAAADLTVDHLVENIIPANLTYKMLRVLRRCQGLRRASGRPFPFHIMKMFYLSDLPGDTSDFPIILSTPEPDRCRINVQIEKPRHSEQTGQFPLAMLPIELRLKIYRAVLWAPVPLKPGDSTFQWEHYAVVDTSILLTCRWVYQEAIPIFQQNHFQIHALYGEGLTHVVNSIGSELTINWYPEVIWAADVLQRLVKNTRIRKLHLNFYPGNPLLDFDPSHFQTWFFFSRAKNLDLDQNDLIYVTKDAPFLQKFLGLPGIELLQLRNLESVNCQFHPSISVDVLTVDDRDAFRVYANRTLTKRRTIEVPALPSLDVRYVGWAVDGPAPLP